MPALPSAARISATHIEMPNRDRMSSVRDSILSCPQCLLVYHIRVHPTRVTTSENVLRGRRKRRDARPASRTRASYGEVEIATPTIIRAVAQSLDRSG